ncbi:MAG: cytochrome c biogenesis protein CcsA [Bacteroidota bacterium]
MRIAVDVLTVLLPVGYAGVVGVYLWAFRSQNVLAKVLKSWSLWALLSAHLGYLVVRTVAFDHPPITTVYEILTVIAFAIAGSYALIEFRTRIKNTGVFIILLAGIFQVCSSIAIEPLVDVHPNLRSSLLGLHVTSALFGFSAFAISAVYALLYLILYHNLKRAKFGLLYDRLPNLESLESLVSSSIFVGFVLLTVAIVLGLIWFDRVVDNASWLDPKLVGTALVWLLYGLGILRYKVLSWSGRKMMFVSIAGFCFSLLSLTVVNLFFSGFHDFR